MSLDDRLHLKATVLGMSFTKAWWDDFNGRQVFGDEDQAALAYVNRMRDSRQAKAQVVYRCRKHGCVLLEAHVVPKGLACRLGAARNGRQGPGRPVRLPWRSLFITAYDLEVARGLADDDPVRTEAGVGLWCDHLGLLMPLGWFLEDVEAGKRIPTRRLFPLELPSMGS